MSDYKPTPVAEKHANFLRDIVELLFKNIVFSVDKMSKVIDWKEPDELKSILNLKIENEAVSHSELINVVEKVLHYSVKTGHPYFINQLFSSLDPYGLAAQWITDALNLSVYTYEVAPVFTLMEQVVIKKFCELVGYDNGDGLFCPGGSLANGIALNIARYHQYPNVKKTGMFALSKLIIFTSEEAHYSIFKMASFLGIGESNVCEIPTDEIGSMNPALLEHEILDQISLGNVPCMVVATMGTTVRGAFDPIEAIALICRKYDLWLHADAAWGGSLLLSKRYRWKLEGLNQANSVTINPHKLLAVPQQCSILLVQNGSLLKQCHAKEAQYLFQKDKHYNVEYDCGDKYIQCGRRCDVFKLYLMWKAKGTEGFGKHVDDIMSASKYLANSIKQRKDFKLVSQPQFVNVCFWYIPPSLQKESSDFEKITHKLQKVAPRIKELLVKEGNIMINYQPLKHHPNFFRFVSQNSSITKEDMDYLLNCIAEKGKHL